MNPRPEGTPARAVRESGTRAGDVVTAIERDALDRVTRVVRTLPDGTTQAVARAFCPDGHKRQVGLSRAFNPAAPSFDQVATYQRDALGRITAILVDGEERVRNHYDPDTLRLTVREFTNGARVGYDLGIGGRPS